MYRLPFVVLLLLAMAGAGPAAAQDFFRFLFGPPRTAPPPEPVQPRILPERETVKRDEIPPAYAGEMARLAEILGALHYLRPLCGADDGNRWREEMQALIDAEQPPPPRRDQIVANFNRAYGTFEQTYRSCTPAAQVAIRRFLDEGARVSREIATTYGN
jgi:uncharacterized protein (TIGR02301 family)